MRKSAVYEELREQEAEATAGGEKLGVFNQQKRDEWL